jgi:hypothetical protein
MERRLILIVGILCLLLGGYYLLTQNSVQVPQLSGTEDVAIPFTSYTDSKWDEYGVGTDNPSNPANVYMRSSGYVTYPLVLTAPPKFNSVTFSVRLSSELLRVLGRVTKHLDLYVAELCVIVDEMVIWFSGIPFSTRYSLTRGTLSESDL